MARNELIAIGTLGAALLIGAWSLRSDAALTAPASPVAVTATPLPLNREDPGATAIGALAFRGAVELRSAEPLFGGISGLRAGPVTADGVRLLAVLDTGHWLSLATIERGGRLVGVRDTWIAPIRTATGGTARTKAEGDAEALEWDPATGTATVVYEQDHRFAHFTGIDAADPASLGAIPHRIEHLTQMAGWPANGGGEAMAELPDGARIVISEQRKRRDGSHAGLVTRAGQTRDIAITGVPDHSPTDAIALDATRILVLHRRFDMMGQGAALTLVDAADTSGDRPLPERLLVRWRAPTTLDNMEGIALRREGDQVMLYLVSDNNLSGLQRTLLMKFELLLAPLQNRN